MPRPIFRLRSKTNKRRRKDAEDGLAQRFAIRMIRLLCSFQANENPPRLFWLLFWAMQKSNDTISTSLSFLQRQKSTNKSKPIA